MSMNVLKEFLIHFNTFRNVDMVNQGLYQIKSRISYTEKNTKLWALPYFFSESKESENILQTDEQMIKPHNIISNHISDKSSDYVTKTFLVRYSDEEVEIDEFCHYRIEVPHEKTNDDLIFHIEFDLYFSDVLMTLKDKKSQNFLNNVQFKSVATGLVSIVSNAFVNSYSPILYSENYSSLLNVSVHLIGLDYKLRVDNIKPYLIEETKKETKNENFNTNKNAMRSVSSLIQFFLEEKDCLYKLDNKTIDDLYEKYVLSLVRTYLLLKDRYSKLVNRLLDEKMKSELPFFVTIQQLIFFQDDKDLLTPSYPNENMQLKDYNSIHQNFASLSARIHDKTSENVSARILYEINYIAGQLFQLWHKYIELLRYFPNGSNYLLQSEFTSKYKEDLAKLIKKSIIKFKDTTTLLLPVESNMGDLNREASVALRLQMSENYLRPHIESLTHHVRAKDFPVIFEEVYIGQSLIDGKSAVHLQSFEENERQPSKDFSEAEEIYQNKNVVDLSEMNERLKLQLIVLVHGFQGNAFDMRLIKNTLALVNPSLVFLSSNANQDDTECDIEEMGRRLANEVRVFIKEWSDGSLFRRISFIGHSIGGLIIRAALPHLMDYADKFWLYMSFSSPHLGYVYSSSPLIDAGLWLLKTWKKSKSLQQLSFSDGKDLRDCLIYRISEFAGLDAFKHLHLVSSHQDLYAPYESTRIQLCKKSLEDNYRAEVYRSMAFNLLSKVNKESLKRYDVNFVIPEKNLDSFIGRTAHIQFLENTQFMKILFYSIEDILK